MVCSNTIIYIVVSEKEKYLKGDEKEKWEIINENYKTEESDDSSGVIPTAFIDLEIESTLI